MPQMILVTGTILASSFGCVLMALLLGSAVSKARRRSRCDQILAPDADNSETSEIPLSDASARGYDSPELCRADYLLRADQASSERTYH